MGSVRLLVALGCVAAAVIGAGSARAAVDPYASLLAPAGQAKLDADIACGDFSHTPCGNPFELVFAAYLQGASGYRLGENIAWGTGEFGTPRQTMDAWLNSAGHRENILAPGYRELGTGYLPNQTFQGYGGATLWSQEFGTRTPDATSAPAPAPA